MYSPFLHRSWPLYCTPNQISAATLRVKLVQKKTYGEIPTYRKAITYHHSKYFQKRGEICVSGQVFQKASKIQGPQRAWDSKSELNTTVEKWYPANATSQSNFCHFLSKQISIDTTALLAIKLYHKQWYICTTSVRVRASWRSRWEIQLLARIEYTTKKTEKTRAWPHLLRHNPSDLGRWLRLSRKLFGL